MKKEPDPNSSSYWRVGLAALAGLSAYRSPVPATTPAISIDAESEALSSSYPYKLHGVLRHTEGTKLRALEEICIIASVPAGKYLIQVENHDMLSGPPLMFATQVARSPDGQHIGSEIIFEDECKNIGPKASPTTNSFYESRFEVVHDKALVWINLRNTGSWRGCKASVVLRGSCSSFRVLDYPSCVQTLPETLDERTRCFNEAFGPSLLRGEVFLGLVHPIVFVQRFRKVFGTVYFTNYQLLFYPLEDSLQPDTSDFIWKIPYGNMARVEFVDGPMLNFKIFCRSFACARLRSSPLAHAQTTLHAKEPEKQIKALLHSLAFPQNVQSMFTFLHGIDISGESQASGWDFYSAEEEFRRQGLDLLPTSSASKWRLTLLNNSFELCETYPQVLVVPRSVTDEQLKAVAAYRSRSRIPTLVWKHNKKDSVIVRCSQPLTGVTGARCEADEAYLQTLRTMNESNPSLIIFDARPQLNAWSQSVMGKGFEDINNYPGCKFKFLDIDNIQAMNKALRRLRDLCLSSESTEIQFRSSDWLVHIERILSGANEVISAVDGSGATALIHCSDGWDRTAQLTSLPQLCLDPYYRTINGFVVSGFSAFKASLVKVLIEKEWLSFGHQFGKRLGFCEGTDSDTYWDSLTGERSPIFLQFIDCVHQLLLNYPTAFEFNDTFLKTIIHHLYSCRFGTFLLNSEKERRAFGIQSKTLSIWSLLKTTNALREFQNPTFNPTDAVLSASVTPVLWLECYLPGNLVSYE